MCVCAGGVPGVLQWRARETLQWVMAILQDNLQLRRRGTWNIDTGCIPLSEILEHTRINLELTRLHCGRLSSWGRERSPGGRPSGFGWGVERGLEEIKRVIPWVDAPCSTICKLLAVYEGLDPDLLPCENLSESLLQTDQAGCMRYPKPPPHSLTRGNIDASWWHAWRETKWLNSGTAWISFKNDRNQNLTLLSKFCYLSFSQLLASPEYLPGSKDKACAISQCSGKEDESIPLETQPSPPSPPALVHTGLPLPCCCESSVDGPSQRLARERRWMAARFLHWKDSQGFCGLCSLHCTCLHTFHLVSQVESWKDTGNNMRFWRQMCCSQHWFDVNLATDFLLETVFNVDENW